MAPIGTQASRSIQDVACNSPDYIFIVWLSETSNTFNKRINSFLFLRINLFLGSRQKVEVKRVAGIEEVRSLVTENRVASVWKIAPHSSSSLTTI